MELLVTGVQREVGQSLIQALRELGHTLHQMEHVPSEAHASTSYSRFDAIIHSDVALCSTRERTAVDDNLLGAKNLLALASRTQVPVVFLSSIVAQGPSNADLPHRSDQPSRPQGLVARSLLSAENLLLRSEIERVLIFRLGVPYGFHGAFSRLCSALKRSQVRPIIGPLALSFVHIKDVARAIVLGLDNPNVKRLRTHLSDGICRDGEDLLNAIEKDDEMAIRIPIRLNRLLLGAAGELTRAFDGWDMAHHIAQERFWTSSPADAERHIGFSAEENWRTYLQQL